MEHSNTELRAELGSCLKQLQVALREFSTHVRRHAHAAWVWQRSRSANAFSAPPEDLSREDTLELIAEAVENIKYEDGQDPHESRICPGIVALSRGGLALADEVNRLKRELAEVLKAMEGRTAVGVVDQRTGERGEKALREVALEGFFFRRLHYWQATRRLEILRESDKVIGTPEYVGFMWANLREIRRTSVAELIKQGSAAGARSLSQPDLEVLKQLPAKEPLALVRPGHTTPKANVRFPSRGGRPPVSKVRIAVLPLLMLGDQLPARLRKLPPAPTPKHFRLTRGDVELERTPLLRSVPVYRYLETYRHRER